ncbi:MAG: hypothetical protein HXX13_10110 [Bacteroidetes bacterium]|nr:hypothetical protein [Bacteroidota bacterium]
MKKSILLFFVVALVSATNMVYAQTIAPDKSFQDTPKTHNMHIASDGKFLYTCNGGKPEEGQISKYTLEGELVGSYKIELDMRSILFNPSDKKLYVSTYDKDVYKISDLVMGVYKQVLHIEDRDGQSTPAFSADGKHICYLENDTLFMYNLKTGDLDSRIAGFTNADVAPYDCIAVAIYNNHIFTWNSEEFTVLAFDMDGNFIDSFELEHGSYAFSLSVANGLIWVSEDGNYDIGTWYGYDLDKLLN